MKNELRFVGAIAGRYAGLALLTALPVLLFHLDTLWLGNNIGEWSLVELVAEAFVLSCILSFARLARHSAVDRRFAVLVAAFFACVLVRELDALLDLVFDGLWQLLVTVIAVSALAWAWRDVPGTVVPMRHFLLSRQGSTMAAGLAIVLVFSRLFGMGDIWSQFVDLESARVVKNAIEECTELLGYTLAMVASAGYRQRRMRALRRQAVRAQPDLPEIEAPLPAAQPR
ncbi:hypothetical protein LY625_06005 [Lysobacter sp. GX 14042]|uniref:hypothetical protein n=1 Tax=Lysobacter sp. GX 14042 TaxID=2907155 RepID=UPI001F319F48|nr:hypothetical protein [Lysobacter sp. GX 14042]MCE7032174.1 hypothetical protein [Lysobacter sp. GX 14042]